MLSLVQGQGNLVTGLPQTKVSEVTPLMEWYPHLKWIQPPSHLLSCFVFFPPFDHHVSIVLTIINMYHSTKTLVETHFSGIFAWFLDLTTIFPCFFSLVETLLFPLQITLFQVMAMLSAPRAPLWRDAFARQREAVRDTIRFFFNMARENGPFVKAIHWLAYGYG